MKIEERLQGGLAALEEIADVEGQRAGHHEENDDEHVGHRRGEIRGQLAAEDHANRAHEVAPFPENYAAAWVISRNTPSSRPRSTRNSATATPRSPSKCRTYCAVSASPAGST